MNVCAVKRKEELARRAAQKNAATNALQPIPEAQRLEVRIVESISGYNLYVTFICKSISIYMQSICVYDPSMCIIK